MFGIEIIDASLLPAMFVALLAGLVSFLSPLCAAHRAPLSGLYVGYDDLGIEEDRHARAPGGACGPCFSCWGCRRFSFFLGFTASAFGAFFLQYQVLLAQISGVVVIIFGLHFLNVFRIPFLDREARIEAGDSGGSAFGAYILGLAFAFGWTPCIGPQLGAILSLAATEASVTRGTLLLAVYAAGLGIPFLLAALFLTRAMGFMNRIKRHMGLIEKVMGLLLVVVGLALLTGAFTAFSFWLLETFPALALLG